MPTEKMTFDEFLDTVGVKLKPFIQNLHNYLSESGCKSSFEEKKSGPLASYKYGKPPKAVANFLFRKTGLRIRIYGENISEYVNLLSTLPLEMVESINNSGECKRLTQNTCSLKCTGYDFMIENEHFQKCRYGCFEFAVTEENNPYIKSFLENEVDSRR